MPDELPELTNSEIFNKEISLFKNAQTTTKPQFLTLDTLLNNIQNGVYADQVNEARHLYSTNQKESYNEFKRTKVAGFTLSAKCNHRKADSTNGRTTDKLIYHTGILQIDIDNIPPEQVQTIRHTLENDKHTLFCFSSIGGNGLKIGININDKYHLESFIEAEKYYKREYNLEIDRSTKDVYRLCFISYDNNLFRNPHAELFINQEISSPHINLQSTIDIQKPLDFSQSTKTTIQSKDGNRAIETAINLLNHATSGNKHNTRLKVGELLGGYVAGGYFSKEYALNCVENAVISNSTLSPDKALKEIETAIEHGTKKPIKPEQIEQARNEYNQRNFPLKKNHIVEHTNTQTGEITKEELPFIFWHEVEDKRGKPELKIDVDGIIEFLIKDGFCLLALDENSLNRMIVQIKNNVVCQSNEGLIRNLLTNHCIELLPDKISDNFSKEQLRAVLRRGINVYVEKNKLDSLPIKRIKFLQDTANESFYFFKNGFVEVSKGTIQLKPYKELSAPIWKSQIIQHNFEVIPENQHNKIEQFDYTKFTKNICSIKEPKKKFDEERHTSLLCTMGYLLHDFKTTANKFSVILSEANIDDEPQGRTGKGLIMQAIRMLRNTAVIDGKTFSFDSQFCYQQIELDTKIMFFDDVKKYFDFQRLYSAITEGLSFEKKGQHRINLSAEESPKIVISTNYGIQGNSESDKGRKFEMELLCYYSSSFKPEHEFGSQFFHTWSRDQWNVFYNFMLLCVQKYFQNDSRIPNYGSATIDEKKLLSATNREFLEYMVNVPRDIKIPCSEFYIDYLDFVGFGDKDKDKPSKIIVGKWLKMYCTYNNIKLPDGETIQSEGKTTKCYKLVTL